MSLVASLGVFVPASVTPAVAAKQPCPESRPDRMAALVTARMCGGKVAIADATTETAQAWANADGSITADVATAPVRARKADGSWAAVDLTLVKEMDGSVVPTAHPNDLRISGAHPGGGEHVLAAVGVGDRRVALSFMGALPEPALGGNRAVYREVKPGVDLVVEATRIGFEQLLIVKDRAAAAQVASIPLALTGGAATGHKRDAAGNVMVVDKAGKPLVEVPAPLMWDAQAGEHGEKLREHPVAVAAAKRAAAKGFRMSAGRGVKADAGLLRAAGVSMKLTPDAAWLADPATRFPVTIDPVVNPYSTSWDTYVKEGSSANYSGAGDLQMGTTTGTDKLRSILAFATTWGPIYVQSATLNLWNWWSPSCAAKSWEMWRVGQNTTLSSSVTWASMPEWIGPLSTSTGTKGFSATCDDGWVSIDAKQFFQNASNDGDTRPYMGLKAASETDTAAFKQFRSRDYATTSQVPYVNITYWPLSSTGEVSITAPAGESFCDITPGGPAIVANSLTPVIKAQVSNPSGGSLFGRFEITNQATGAVVATGTGFHGRVGPEIGLGGAVGQAGRGCHLRSSRCG